MIIETYRVKQYSSKPVTVVIVDKKPICTVRGKQTLSKIISRLSGYDIPLSDKKIEREIDKLLEVL